MIIMIIIIKIMKNKLKLLHFENYALIMILLPQKLFGFLQIILYTSIKN